MCGSMCKLLLIDMVKNTGRFEQMANRYIEGKTDEYSIKRAWSSISEQYPEGLTRGVIQVHEQWSRQGQTVQMEGKGLIQDTRQKIRNQTTRQHEKTKLETETRNGSVKQLTLGER